MGSYRELFGKRTRKSGLICLLAVAAFLAAAAGGANKSSKAKSPPRARGADFIEKPPPKPDIRGIRSADWPWNWDENTAVAVIRRLGSQIRQGDRRALYDLFHIAVYTDGDLSEAADEELERAYRQLGEDTFLRVLARAWGDVQDRIIEFASFWVAKDPHNEKEVAKAAKALRQKLSKLEGVVDYGPPPPGSGARHPAKRPTRPPLKSVGTTDAGKR